MSVERIKGMLVSICETARDGKLDIADNIAGVMVGELAKLTPEDIEVHFQTSEEAKATDFPAGFENEFEDESEDEEESPEVAHSKLYSIVREMTTR